MNFASHYYFQSSQYDLFNAGLILTDLIPLVSNKNFPLLPAVRNAIKNENMHDPEMQIFMGMNAHFKADLIFHRSSFFLNSLSLTSKNSVIAGTIPPILHHILVEMCIDRYIAIHHPDIVSAMYDSFSSSYLKALEIISPYIPLSPDMVFFCERFCERRTIMKYPEFNVIVKTLEAIAGKAGIKIEEHANMIAGVGTAYLILEKKVAAYLFSSKKTYREMENFNSHV